MLVKLGWIVTQERHIGLNLCFVRKLGLFVTLLHAKPLGFVRVLKIFIHLKARSDFYPLLQNLRI